MDHVPNSGPPHADANRPVPVESEHVKPAGPATVSRAPLTLGGAPKPPAVAIAPHPTPAAHPVPMPHPASAASGDPVAPAMPKIVTSTPITKKLGAALASTDRIGGVKTFYTKLHPGAIEFLDDQIITWLKDNPAISIKHVTVATGEVQGKKTEANIIINVWY
jgi:hypothetical protein